MSAHLNPTQIRSRLKHPVVDADGHWIEYGPVFAEQMRKVGGDKAADGFLSIGRGTAERAGRCRSPVLPKAGHQAGPRSVLISGCRVF